MEDAFKEDPNKREIEGNHFSKPNLFKRIFSPAYDAPKSTLYLICSILLASLIVGIILSILCVLLTININKWDMAYSNYKDIRYEDRSNEILGLVPYDKDNKVSDFNIFLDGHSHTYYSDGILSPEEVLKWGMSVGYNAMIITDHNTIKGGMEAQTIARLKYPMKIKVIVGEEYTCCRIHMNLIHINETIPVDKAWPTDEELKAVIRKTHQLEGKVIVNHWPWSHKMQSGMDTPVLMKHPSLEELIEWGVDGFEIINMDTFDLPTLQYLQRQHSSLILITGSDMHYPSSAYSWTLLSSPEFTEEDIWSTLISNSSTKSFMFNPTGTHFSYSKSFPKHTNSYYALTPLLHWGEYLMSTFISMNKGMYSFCNGEFCHSPQTDIHYISIIMALIYMLLSVFIIILFSFIFGYLLIFRKKLALNKI